MSSAVTIDYREPVLPPILATNERVTGPAALHLLISSSLLASSTTPTDAGALKILDNATGTGVLASVLLQLKQQGKIAREVEIVAADKEPSMVNLLKMRAEKRGWSNVKPEVFDMKAIPYGDASFDYVFSNMGIFFSDAPATALSDAFRVLRPSGQVGLTAWQSISWWPHALAALAKYSPDALSLPSNPMSTFPDPLWNDDAHITSLLTAAGFKDLKIERYTQKLDVEKENFVEASAFLVGLVAARFWSQEKMAKYGGPKIKENMLKYLEEVMPGEMYDGEMTSISILGKKP